MQNKYIQFHVEFFSTIGIYDKQIAKKTFAMHIIFVWNQTFKIEVIF